MKHQEKYEPIGELVHDSTNRRLFDYILWFIGLSEGLVRADTTLLYRVIAPVAWVVGFPGKTRS